MNFHDTTLNWILNWINFGQNSNIELNQFEYRTGLVPSLPMERQTVSRINKFGPDACADVDGDSCDRKKMHFCAPALPPLIHFQNSFSDPIFKICCTIYTTALHSTGLEFKHICSIKPTLHSHSMSNLKLRPTHWLTHWPTDWGRLLWTYRINYKQTLHTSNDFVSFAAYEKTTVCALCTSCR